VKGHYETTKPIPLGARVDYNNLGGKVAAIIFLNGERYYMLVDSDGSVSLLPACAVEPPKEAA
jgi:hypothetical protein